MMSILIAPVEDYYILQSLKSNWNSLSFQGRSGYEIQQLLAASVSVGKKRKHNALRRMQTGSNLPEEEFNKLNGYIWSVAIQLIEFFL